MTYKARHGFFFERKILARFWLLNLLFLAMWLDLLFWDFLEDFFRTNVRPHHQVITESVAIDDQAGLLMWWRHVECPSCREPMDDGVMGTFCCNWMMDRMQSS